MVLVEQTHCFSSSTCSVGSRVRSEYQGFGSFADGARGTPFSVSAGVTFLVALMAAIIELYSFEKMSLVLIRIAEEEKPTCSKSSNKLICPLVVGSTGPRVELFATKSLRSSSSRRFFFFSALSTPDFSRSKSMRASESY